MTVTLMFNKRPLLHRLCNVVVRIAVGICSRIAPKRTPAVQTLRLLRHRQGLSLSSRKYTQRAPAGQWECESERNCGHDACLLRRRLGVTEWLLRGRGTGARCDARIRLLDYSHSNRRAVTKTVTRDPSNLSVKPSLLVLL